MPSWLELAISTLAPSSSYRATFDIGRSNLSSLVAGASIPRDLMVLRGQEFVVVEGSDGPYKPTRGQRATPLAALERVHELTATDVNCGNQPW